MLKNKINEKCRLLACIFLVAIIVFGFIANLIVTQGYKITVQHVTLEVRGGDLTMDIYRPSKITPDTKLPCMIVSHGGSECLAADTIHAWEYARRGLVVINLNMYGAGTADMIDVTEDGKPYNRQQSPSGLYDVIVYARQMVYVDTTRIGIWGHSQSYSTLGAAIKLDGGLLSLNDRMFNALHDEFGIEITAEQLALNADDVAKTVLDDAQMLLYDYIKVEQQEIVDNYIRAARVFDNNTTLQKTTVAGIEVERSIHTNLQIGGERHGTSATSATRFTQPSERYMKIFCVDGPMLRNAYYLIPDTVANPDARSTMLGEQFTTGVLDNAALREGFDNHSVYFTFNPPTMHNGNLWSVKAIGPTMEFFTQALGYNNGWLTDAATKPISCMDISASYTALAFTTLALFAMIGFIASMGGVLLQSKFFEPCEVAAYVPKLAVKSKDFIFALIASVVAGFVGAWVGSKETWGYNMSNKFMSKFLPTEPGHWRLIFMIMATAAAGALMFFLLKLISKKFSRDGESGVASLADLQIKQKPKNVFKSLALCGILFVFAYILEAFMEGAFQVRFQFVDGSFEMMKAYSWVRMIKYAIILVPFTFVISCLNNMISFKGVNDTTDTLLNVGITSLGAWIFISLATAITFSTPDHMSALGLHTMLPAIFLVPLTNYTYRKFFKVTGSPWAGAFMVALILAWRLASYVSHRFMFWGYDSVVTQFFGI